MEITEIRKEHCPASRFIGKRYTAQPNWAEWWENGWFDLLEKLPILAFNQDAYIGAVRAANDISEHWIGMFFPADTQVPDEFEAFDLPAADYAVCYLRAEENSPDFYTASTHSLCLKALTLQGWTHPEGGWRFERYQCPRFTVPDEHGRVILDYCLSIL